MNKLLNVLRLVFLSLAGMGSLLAILDLCFLYLVDAGHMAILVVCFSIPGALLHLKYKKVLGASTNNDPEFKTGGQGSATGKK